MKQNIKKLFFTLSIFISMLLNSCQHEEILEKNQNESQIHSKVSVAEVEYNSLLKDSNFKKALSNFESKIRLKVKMAKTTGENLYDFKILKKNIKVTKTNQITSYTIPVYRNVNSEKSFENLILQVNDKDQTTALLVKYEPNLVTSGIINNENNFNGNIKVAPIDMEIYQTNQNARWEVICFDFVS